MSDLVVNVRQVSSYPLGTPPVMPTDTVLLQRGGLGGPYLSVSVQALVAAALASGPTLQAGATPVSINCAGDIGLPNGAAIAWDSSAGLSYQPPLGFVWNVGNSESMFLSPAGALSLPFGTLTVARDPASALEVATMGYVGNHTVASFNGRNGFVTLSQSDIYQALCLDSPIASQQWVNGAITAGLQGMLFTCPFVNRWNGRTGSVNLMLSDITCVFFQPGQIPITQTPPATSDDYSIANTAWVTNYVTNEFSGAGSLATQAWVLANTVTSFNGRLGAVTLALSDITSAGGAPLNSPQLSGVPTAPTQAVGNASAAIATTAFVWSAVQESTTGVVSWNGRTGVVTLDATDINNAGGALLNSPAFTNVPTAPTAAVGTTTTQLATCAFVLNEVQAIGAGVTSFNTRSGNVVLELTDITSAGGAPIASPNFSGNPTTPTPASPVAATTSIPNTNWVVQYCNLNTVASFNTRTGAVTLNANDITAAGGLANPNVALTGAPTAPTAIPGTNTTEIATCQFVQQAIQNIGGITVSPSPPASPFTGQAWFNTTAGVQQLNVWTGAAWTPSTNLSGYAQLSGAVFTGPVTIPAGSSVAGYLPLTGGTVSGALTMAGGASVTAGSFAVAGGTTLSGGLTVQGANGINVTASGGVTSPPAVVWDIGNPTSFFPHGSALFEVGNTSGGAAIFSSNAASAGGATLQIRYDRLDGVFIYFFFGTTAIGSINSTSGNSVNYNTTSDGRLKTNIAPMTDSAAIIDALTPVTFNWTNDAAGTPLSHGFVAQDVEPIFAGSVTPGIGSPGQEGFRAYGMDHSKLVPVLTAEIKSLRSRVAALEAKAAA